MNKKISQKRHDEICDRLAITKHLVDKVKSYGNATVSGTHRLKSIISQYTGVKEEIVEEALNYKKKKTFSDLYLLSDQVSSHNYDPSAFSLRFEDVRRIIFDLYVNELQIPNKHSIIQALLKLPRYKDYSVSNLETDLYYIGFIWKRLPNSKKYIVVEKSEQFMERMKYLQRMLQYRSDNRVLIHVERTIIKYQAPLEITMAACPQTGLIDISLPFQTLSMENWLQTIIHGIPSNSVFVMQLPSNTEEKMNWIPNIHNGKDEMIKWLEAHGIPHDPKQHSAELYALVQKYKCHYPSTYKFVASLEAVGHEVIIRPPVLNGYFDLSFLSDKLSSSSSIHAKPLITKTTFQEMIYEKFSGYSLLKWLMDDRKMADREMQMFDEDQKLELVLDNLLDKINDGCISEADLDACDGKECDLKFCDRILVPQNK